MKKIMTLIFIVLLSPRVLLAGYGKSYNDNYRPTEVKGTMSVQPELARIEINIRTSGMGYLKSFKQSEKMIQSLRNQILEIDNKNISFLTDNYSKSSTGSKKMISFSMSGSSTIITTSFSVAIFLDKKEAINKSIEKIAKILDKLRIFNNSMKDKKEYEDVSLSFSTPIYIIKDVENHRKTLVENILDRSQVVAKTISAKTKRKYVIHSADCNQDINVQSLNIQNTMLTLSCRIFYVFK